MAATPQQRFGNAVVTNLPEYSTDELQRLFATLVAPSNKRNKNIVKKLTGVKIDHAERGIKAGASKLSLQCSTQTSGFI